MGGLFILLFLCSARMPIIYASNNACTNEDVSLNFSNTSIIAIGEYFINSPLITYLNFERSGLREIAVGAFNRVPNLMYLNLAQNDLRMNNILSFGGHGKLETMVLNSQAVSNYELVLRVTGRYPNLRYLYATNNAIEDIEIEGDAIDTQHIFPHLRVLDLSNNRLIRAPATILPETLTHLYLHENRIDYFSLYELPHLRELTMNNNYIESVDGSFEDMVTLKHLSLAHNKLTSIDNAFESMAELLMLDLSYNDISTISLKAFDPLINLRNLSLDNNYLMEIPSIRGSPFLINLSLRCNQLTHISPDAFYDLPLLEKLLLSGNMISHLSSGSFAGLKSLRELSLGKNALISMPSEWSAPLDHLRYLDLSENGFTTLESLSMHIDLPLEQLYLQNNTLKYLKSFSFISFPTNVTVNLNGESKTPFDSFCDCIHE